MEAGCGRPRRPYKLVLRYFENSPVESLKSLEDSVDGIVMWTGSSQVAKRKSPGGIPKNASANQRASIE